MEQKNPRAFRHFARHLFLMGKLFAEKTKAEEDLDRHLLKMKNSIVRLSLTYGEIERLREKINKLVDCERRYAKFFRPEDSETAELREHILNLQEELNKERLSKENLTHDYEEKINQLNGTIEGMTSQLMHHNMEKAKRQQKLISLDKKIKEKIDTSHYYGS